MPQWTPSEGCIPGSEAPAAGHNRVRLIFRVLLVVCVSASLSASVLAQEKPSEYDVKAAYLFNFARFIRFDPRFEPHSTFDICILGQESIGRTLDQITAGESINKLPVRIMLLPDATKGRQCAVLFLGSAERDSIREDLALLAGTDVLTVSDLPDFIERGGMIQFLLDGDHVRFAVNLDAINRTHVSLSSELLRVAASIKGHPGPGGRR